MKIHLGFILGFAAISLAACAAFFSVYGLSQLFAGASLSVIIMASTLEFSKLVIATYLHGYWSKISKILRTYLTLGVVILAIITSAGIYGYLSSAYQITAVNLEKHEGQVGIYDTKINLLKETIKSNTNLIESKSKRLDQVSDIRNKQDESALLDDKKKVSRRTIESSNTTINQLNKEIDALNTTNNNLNDSIGVLTTTKLEVSSNSSISGEVGPLKYMAEITGMPMNKIVNIFILLLVFVFDPLAICLVIATNGVFLEKNKKEEEPIVPVPTEEPKEPLIEEDKILPIVEEMELEEVAETTQAEIENIEIENIEDEVSEEPEPIVVETPTRLKFEDIREIKEMNLKNDVERNFSKKIPKNNYIEKG